MALQHPEINVAAITVVAGNVDLDQAVQNALYTVARCGRDTPVHAGASAPLLRDLVTAQEVHGQDGMGDIGLDVAGRGATPGWGPGIIVDELRSNPGETTVVTLGPLTNLATALLWAPDIAEAAKRVVVMGGTGLNGPGNASPNAEFNFWVDPEAVRVVLRAGLPLEFVGWDISIASAVVTPERHDEIRRLDSELADFCLDIQSTVADYANTETQLQGPDLPDPIAMAHAIDPTPATMRKVAVDIAIGPDPMRGALIVDRFGFHDGVPNVDMVTDYPEPAFFELLQETLKIV